jgi:hypothetical protein
MSEKIYALLLKLYPAHFRKDYRSPALQLFRDRLGAERGVLGRFRLWVDIIKDLFVSVPREHWRRVPPDSASDGWLRISGSDIAAMTKRQAIIPAVFFGLFLLLGMWIGWLGDASHTFLWMAYSTLAIVGLRQFLWIRLFQERFKSYRLTIATDRIRRVQDGREVVLLKNEVTRINEDQYGLKIVGFRREASGEIAQSFDYRRTRDGVVVIWVPAGLTDYDRVKAELLQWTDRFSQRRCLWLAPMVVLACVVNLIPALLLLHSNGWFFVVTAIYYATLLIAILMHVARPPRHSGLAQRRRGWTLPSPSYMWRRLQHSCGNPVLLILLCLPVLKILAFALK